MSALIRSKSLVMCLLKASTDKCVPLACAKVRSYRDQLVPSLVGSQTQAGGSCFMYWLCTGYGYSGFSQSISNPGVSCRVPHV